MSRMSYTERLIERRYSRRDTGLEGRGWELIQMKHCSVGPHSRGSLLVRMHNQALRYQVNKINT